MYRRVTVATAFILGLWALGCEQEAPPPEAPRATARPDIVFLMIDTLRADRVGVYGSETTKTPNMDAIAAEGVTFDRAIAPAPWTLPSIASMFSGVNPSVHGANDYETGPAMVSGNVRVVHESFVTLAERLRDAGYTTAAFVSNPFIIERHGFAQGFEHFDASFASNSTPGNVVNEAALAWLADREDERPVFLYLHYMDVHAPYVVEAEAAQAIFAKLDAREAKRELTPEELSDHPGFFRKNAGSYRGPVADKLARYADYYTALYDGAVERMDGFIGELRAGLAERGVWDDAYVILTADHGEALGEHRIWTHGFSVHQNQVHIPLVFRWPERLGTGTRVEDTVRLIDVYPTLLEQLDLAPTPDIQGVALSAQLSGGRTQSLRGFSEAVKRDPTQMSLVDGDWKVLVAKWAPDGQLFNIERDPMEQEDLSEAFPARLRGLANLAEETARGNARRSEAAPEAAETSLSPEQLERLAGLGYVELESEGGDERDDDGNP